MEFDTVLIKMEPEDEIKNENSSNVFDCETSQNFIKTQTNSQVEYIPTNFNNEELNISITNFICKTEPAESLNDEKTVLKHSDMEVEDIFDENDQVDLSKLEQLMNHSKNTPECSNMKHNNEEFHRNNIIGKEPIIKTEEEECYISEDPLQLSESNNSMYEGYQNVQIPEVILQSNEYDDNKFLVDTENDGKQQRIFAPNQSSHLRKQKKKEPSGEIYKCTICAYETTVKPYLNKHIKSVHMEQKPKINCLFCDKSFGRKHSLDDHTLQKHYEEIKNNIEYFISTKIHTCHLCTYKTTHNVNLNIHINLMHNKQKIHCQFCDRSFARQHSLNDHLLKQHKKELNRKIYQCYNCSYHTTIKSSLSRHITTSHVHRTRKICEFCDKSFALQESLDDHVLKRHKDKSCLTKSKIHRCNTCSYHTTYKSLLDRHVNSVHNEQRLKINCPFCDKSFSYKYSLDDHLLKQHEEEVKNDKDIITNKIHTCDFCDYRTTIKTNLCVHINSNHNAQKSNYQHCQFCDRTFALKYSLDEHILKQHQDKISLIKRKIYTCSVCCFQTTIKSYLSRHKSIHAAERTKINCQFCDKLFITKWLRDDHLLKKHKEVIKNNVKEFITTTIYTCDICSYQTTIKPDFDKHFSLSHSEVKIEMVDEILP